MEFQLKTLTPLWTGGVEASLMNCIHETGIIGSLRWWYEAILRGMGNDVCNPTADNSAERCPRGNDFCNVCHLFGATGNQRNFRLRLGRGKPLVVDGSNILIPSGRIHRRSGESRAGGWYLMVSSVMGDEIPMRIIPLAESKKLSHLRLILALVERHAAVGGKIANGYGVFEVQENGQSLAIEDALKSISILQRESQRESSLPDLRDFYFAKFRFHTPKEDSNWWQSIQGISQAWAGEVTDGDEKVNVYHRNSDNNKMRCELTKRRLTDIINDGLLPLAPAVRNYLRFQWFPTRFRSGSASRNIEKFIFGCTNRYENTASKINVSHAYLVENGDWEFRVWGWIPCRLPSDFHRSREEFLTDLQSALTDETACRRIFGKNSPVLISLTEWHSLDSNQHDGLAYLKELLGATDEGGVA